METHMKAERPRRLEASRAHMRESVGVFQDRRGGQHGVEVPRTVLEVHFWWAPA